MALHTLILGGARSGKSAHAERLVETLSGERIFIATAEAGDSEMAARIRRHKARRKAGWRTVEAPLDLTGALDRSAAPERAVLVDCLTLWLSNLMHAERDPERAVQDLADSLGRAKGPVVLVSNEVGLGIVPENVLARDFRDHAGRMNQRIAAASDEVLFMAAGLPLTLKSPETEWSGATR